MQIITHVRIRSARSLVSLMIFILYIQEVSFIPINSCVILCCTDKNLDKKLECLV